MRLLFIGDIVGQPGRNAVRTMLPKFKEKYKPHLIVANGENAAGGRGITSAIVKDLLDAGVHAITMGNHTWDNKDIYEWIDQESRVIRPANFPEGTPGRGFTVVRANGYELFVLNLQGRTFLPPLECPFRTADALWNEASKYRFKLIDLHAEATSEKIAFGWYMDGRASLVVGTHTHVQTNDARILPQGTGYLTDVGMTGPRDGVLGMERNSVIGKFLTQMPARFVVDEGKWQINAVLAEFDDATGRATKVQTIAHDEDTFWME
ncbi:TIGR00282 family metallophosphoesterase [Paenibacillus thermoaerophilus]|uniref:TIGR00282 family metallophosphoesterase n=1 Tax=Paenibacillus thermoaerophilus TaxID=1215385 RepID=A0ABW2V0Z3_9BACL|nr:TIGR00282 family metallophosphoesterase [Paenibacillus thermoaerophilus]TMV13868.1 TIGR00282 family metallophosphoesterase [Paenibacillus thermoaerophilus]